MSEGLLANFYGKETLPSHLQIQDLVTRLTTSRLCSISHKKSLYWSFIRDTLMERSFSSRQPVNPLFAISLLVSLYLKF
ncbi:uncharacterized protein BDV17DRAFT_276226 [Aspergillus undulatus]|uniref:uncharacterized protein n=1 Tax=Aspergillus undulatus TaxID=1810928 RepID=UPI003CCD4040